MIFFYVIMLSKFECLLFNKLNDEDKTCGICLNVMLVENCNALSCGHAFCTDCINKWHKISKRCPMCKTPSKFTIDNTKLINLAIENNYLELAELVIKHNQIDIDLAMRHAVLRERLNIVKLIIIYYNGCINEDTPHLQESLYLAAGIGNINIISEFFNLEICECTIFMVVMIAIKYNYIYIIMFIYEDLDLCLGCKKESMILSHAAKHNKLDVIKLFCEYEWDINIGNDKCFRSAVKHRRISIAKYIYKLGVDVYAADDYAIKHACKNIDYEMIAFFLENNVDKQKITNYVLHYYNLYELQNFKNLKNPHYTKNSEKYKKYKKMVSLVI
jgi:Ring finger domain